MNNIFKLRWFKFVVRTLIDWIALVALFVLAGIIRNIIDPPICTYDHEFNNTVQSIIELEDSIKKMQQKLDTYEKAVNWFRNADDEELQRGIEQIRSVPKDVPLP